jgi:RimJ/RimL family protein N-acetyltransferase
MTIRDAVAADVPAIYELEHRKELRTFIGRWTEEQHKKALADEDFACLVMKNDAGDLVGYAILRGVASEDRSIELKRIVVEAPGQGLGKKLLQFVAKRVFKEWGAHRLFLDVYETNPRAKRVYEAFGFQVEGVMRESSYRDGEYHSQVLMSLLDREYEALHGSTNSEGA